MERKFFAFMLEYGLMEFEGDEYMTDQCVITGNSMDTLFKEFCKANGYKEDDPNWKRNNDGSITYWGFPICFIEVSSEFKLDTDRIEKNIRPKYTDLFLQEKFEVPFPDKTEAEYPQSKFWDCEYPIKRIIEGAKNCILNTKFKPHKSDDSYGLMCLYFPTGLFQKDHPNATRESVFEIGICEDGFVYNGSLTKIPDNDRESLYIMDTKKAVDIMLEFRKFMISRDSFASKLVTARTDVGNTLKEDCVNIVLSNSYELEKKYQTK